MLRWRRRLVERRGGRVSGHRWLGGRRRLASRNVSAVSSRDQNEPRLGVPRKLRVLIVSVRNAFLHSFRSKHLLEKIKKHSLNLHRCFKMSERMGRSRGFKTQSSTFQLFDVKIEPSCNQQRLGSSAFPAVLEPWTDMPTVRVLDFTFYRNAADCCKRWRSLRKTLAFQTYSVWHLGQASPQLGFQTLTPQTGFSCLMKRSTACANLASCPARTTR